MPSLSASKITLQQIRNFFPKGTVIFAEGDARGSAYIIESGMVEISVSKGGSLIPLVRLGQGEVFGEAALLGEGKRTATVRAVEDTEVFVISPHLIRDRITRLDPIVGLLMSLLVSRYRKWRHKSADDVSDVSDVPEERENFNLVEHADDFMSDLKAQKNIALAELRMAQEITQAIARNEFAPHFQPIVSMQDRKLMGFESLIRWTHPDRGMIPPADFIPVAERTGVVWDLDCLMLENACRIVPELQKTAGDIGRRLYVTVNLSGSHFDTNRIVTRVGDIIKKSGVDPRHIVLEITESALMGDPVTAENALRDLKKSGLRVALDDFGTGYSSLGYLHRFPIDILKIDRSFVQEIHHSKKSLDVVRAITGLARMFNISVVAEGIESEDEIFALSGIGCDFGQGYFFSKPMPVAKAHDFIRDEVTKRG